MKNEKIFSDELERIVDVKNSFMDFLQKFNDGDVRINNDYILYRSSNVTDNHEIKLPNSQIRLYGLIYNFTIKLFDTEEELINYVKNGNESYKNVCAIDYLGDFAGRNYVIKITYLDGKYVLCTQSEDFLFHYDLNIEKSKEEQKPVWEVKEWNLESIYNYLELKEIILDNPFKNIFNLIRGKK